MWQHCDREVDRCELVEAENKKKTVWSTVLAIAHRVNRNSFSSSCVWVYMCMLESSSASPASRRSRRRPIRPLGDGWVDKKLVEDTYIILSKSLLVCFLLMSQGNGISSIRTSSLCRKNTISNELFNSNFYEARVLFVFGNK